MASAYAALVSLAHIIEQIQNQFHPSLDQLHINEFKILSESISFFIDLFEHRNYDTYDHVFESHIAHTAQMVEDLIESHIVDQTINHQDHSTTIHDVMYEGIQTAIQGMDVLRKHAITYLKEIDENTVLLLGSSSLSLTVAASDEDSLCVVGLDDALTTIMGKLTQQHESGRRVIAISGMGGIGKTTLARKLYEHNYMVYHFDIRSWATISKNYSSKQILIELISHLKFLEGDDDFSQMSMNDLGVKLYKCLSGRRYLVILDDMWDVGAWDKVRSFFPASNESGVVITTRELNVSSLGFYCYGMRLLDERESWDLFRSKVFRKDDYCTPELEEIGRNISKNCKGLPLSIVVIGGHLAKTPRTREYWSYIADGLNPLVKLDDYERCLQILSMSYVNLPLHLKPCFLYMGTFHEDEKIRVSRLVRLWVAEGFLKKIEGKSPEETAEHYVRDLIGRNLISAHKPRPTGRIKYCEIHDLLRDICLKEARERKFLYVAEDCDLESHQSAIENQRRLVVHGRMLEEDERHSHFDDSVVLHRAPLLRTLIYQGTLPPLDNLKSLRLLRSAYMRDGQPEIYNVKLDFINELVSLRHIDVSQLTFNPLSVPSSICLLWNLQTLIVQGSLEDTQVPSEIWKMPQLRHLNIFSLRLPEPPDDNMVLNNLLSLKEIANFNCSDNVVCRIPNIRKLRIYYSDNEELTGSRLGSHALHNLSLLDKLESFTCSPVEVEDPKALLEDIYFPYSLKKLSISQLTWEDITSKIGSLPLLEVLTLINCTGPEWELVEGQFSRLKFLQLVLCPDLECFAADKRHFQCLERLDLVELYELREISSDVVDIETLTLMKVICCGDDAVTCAKDIAETQDGNGNQQFLAKVQLRDGSELSEEELSSDSHNFQIVVVN